MNGSELRVQDMRVFGPRPIKGCEFRIFVFLDFGLRVLGSGLSVRLRASRLGFRVWGGFRV